MDSLEKELVASREEVKEVKVVVADLSKSFNHVLDDADP